MTPLIRPRRVAPPRSALPSILLRTLLVIAAVVGMNVASGGVIRRELSGNTEGSLASVGERAVMSIRGTIDGSLRRVSVP
jgi:hypothetical protein